MIRLINPSSQGGEAVYENTITGVTQPNPSSGRYQLIFNHNLGYQPGFMVAKYRVANGDWVQCWSWNSWDTTYGWRYWGNIESVLSSTQAIIDIGNVSGHATQDITIKIYK